jgi:hypothetical protein
MRLLRPVALAALAAVTLEFAACGGEDPQSAPEVSVLVTADYGEQPVGSAPPQSAGGDGTVLSLLEDHFEVEADGGRVTAIDGRTGDWKVFVNGLRLETPPGQTELTEGDRIWWDAHEVEVPAVVGSYPEQFSRGVGGSRWPVRVECPKNADRGSCDVIAKRLGESGILAAQSLVGTEGGDEILRVLVGPWSILRADRAARLVDLGPQASGVFARFSDDGRKLALLGADGRAVRELGQGSGLIATTVYEDQPPTWLVTGTDAAGVAAAVRAFDEGTLANRFALAVGEDRGIPLPVRANRAQ